MLSGFVYGPAAIPENTVKTVTVLYWQLVVFLIDFYFYGQQASG